MTFTDALNYIIGCIERATDGSLLTVTLTRLAVLSANRPDRGNRRMANKRIRKRTLIRLSGIRLFDWLAAIPLARRINP